MPRVNGDAPGYPRYFSSLQSSGRSAWVYKRRTGTAEIVVKRARPCSSRLTPAAAPIGFSGDFSSVGASVSSAHFFSCAEGRRLSKTSVTGLSASCGLDGFFSGMMTPVFYCDDRERRTRGQGVLLGSERPVGHELPIIALACGPVPTLSRISRIHSQHDKDAAADLRGHQETLPG